MKNSEIRQLVTDFGQLLGVSQAAFRKPVVKSRPRRPGGQPESPDDISGLLQAFLVDLIGMEVDTP